MIKLQVDPITNKVLSYTKVLSNTLIYKDDIIIDEASLPEMNNEYMYIDGEFVEINGDNYDASLEKLNKEIREISNVSDTERFVSLYLEGKTMSAAKNEVLDRKQRFENLTKQREIILQEKEIKLRNHYLQMNRIEDNKLNCLYYSSVILLIKHENRYLKEWIDWHLSLGFEHVYIYDNGTEEKVDEIVDEYSTKIKNKITVIDWSGSHAHIQQDAYNHFMENYKQDTRWGLFIDSDEFLRFTNGISDVNTFLKDYEDYTEVWGYEVEYNANGHETYEDSPVRSRFTHQVDTREGFYWKNFIQVNRIDSFLMHYAYYDKQKNLMFKNEQSNQDLFVIEHYYTKSWEEWQWKIKERGGADPHYHKALKEFFVYNPDMAHLDTGENTYQKYE